jgi:hypothetical protein
LSLLAAIVAAVKGAAVELLIPIALGYVAWRVFGRKRPRSGGFSQPPPPTGRPAHRPAFVYAVFSVSGREGWPPAVMKAVEGIYEIASADEPTTVGKMRAVAKRLTKLGTPVFEFLDSVLDRVDDEHPSRTAFEDLHSLADELVQLADEAEEAEDELDVDVIARAQEFVDQWQKTPNPETSSS